MYRFALTALFGALCLLFWQFRTDQRPIVVAQLADASQYRGDLENGVLNGVGELKAGSGSHYRGQFKDGLFHGQGRIDYPDGAYYMGEFENGLFHGQGTYQDQSGRYQGQFIEGDLTGAGSHQTDEGSLYTGHFDRWQYQGQGQYQDSLGNRWQGEFVDGVANGQGEYFGRDGSVYSGNFYDGLFQGQGRLIDQGDVYQGEFLEGYYHGQGTLTYSEPVDGISTLTGLWQYGDLIEGQHAPAAIAELAEKQLYNHQQNFQQAIDQLAKHNPDTGEIYFLGIAGDGTQGVFHRELNTISLGLMRQGISKDRQLLLVNSRKNLDYPLATRRSIQEALGAISEKMNSREDLLLIYMTSHGSAEHALSLQQPGIELADLPAEDLGAWIHKLPIENKVIIISSCYSGGFIPHLKADKHLVISAAAADKTSFGCTDRGTMTWFGEAYFKDTLFNSESFEQNILKGANLINAFGPAKTLIAHREAAENIPASEPQISRGSDIENFLMDF